MDVVIVSFFTKSTKRLLDLLLKRSLASVAGLMNTTHSGQY